MIPNKQLSFFSSVVARTMQSKIKVMCLFLGSSGAGWEAAAHCFDCQHVEGAVTARCELCKLVT